MLEPLAEGLWLSLCFLGRLHSLVWAPAAPAVWGVLPAGLPATFRPPLAGAPTAPPDPGSLCPCHWPHWTTEPVRGCFCHRPDLPLDELRRVQGCGGWVAVPLPLQGLLGGPEPASAVPTTLPCWALSEPPFLVCAVPSAGGAPKCSAWGLRCVSDPLIHPRLPQ